MKKVLFTLVALALVSATAFAAPTVAVSAEISGEAYATVGFDLDGGDLGIKNGVSSNIKVIFVAEATEEKGGEGVYGWIKLENFKAEISNADGTVFTKPTISAKLYINPIYVDIVGANNEVNFASLAFGGNLIANTNNYSENPVEQFQGIAVGLVDETTIKFVAGVASQYSYDNALFDNDNWNAYAQVGIGTDIVEGLNFDVKFAYEGASQDSALGVQAGFETGMIVVGAGYDLGLTAETQEVSFKAQYKLEGDKTKFTLPGAAEVEYNPGFAVSALVDLADNANPAFELDLDVAATFFDAALVEALDLVAFAEARNVLNALDLGLGVHAAYAVSEEVKAGAAFTTVNYDAPATQDVTRAKLWIEYTGITNTTLTFAWTSGNLALDPAQAGVLEFTTKIAY